jgi:hypothetical protein
MSTMPWGTMNGWLRTEGEQRGRWLQQRVQDLRAAQVVKQVESMEQRPQRIVVRPQPTADLDRAEAA